MPEQTNLMSRTWPKLVTRFEATFWDEPRIQAGTLLYSWKFIDRVGPTYFGKTYPPQYKSITNTNDYPVMRLAEVMLNWLEAKAELALMGGDPIIQDDIENNQPNPQASSR